MAFLQRIPATARVPRDPATGLLRRGTAENPGCCCACAGCAGKSAGQFTVTLADVALAQGCTPAGGTGNFMNVDQAALAGTFTLDRQADDPLHALPGRCVWFYGETPGVTVSAQAYRNAGNCTDNPTGDFGFYLRLSREGGEFTLEAWLGDADLIFHDLFVARFASEDCASPLAAATGEGGAVPFHPKGGGGTAVLTPG